MNAAANVFLAGLLHPFLVPAHVIALVAVGLMIAQQGPGDRAVLLIVFIAALAGGFVAVVLAVAANYALLYLLAASAAAGLLATLGRPLPLALTVTPAAVTGAAFIFDSVPQDISMSASAAALAASACAAGFAVAALAVLVVRLRHPYLQVGMRIIASWAAASAILVLALHFARFWR